MLVWIGGVILRDRHIFAAQRPFRLQRLPRDFSLPRNA
jgi:hypothetical protein